jgi:hypothetical protein
MPFFMLLLGALFIAGAVNNTLTGDAGLFGLVKKEFTGQPNFMTWAAALGLVGAAGMYKPLQHVANTFLVLIFLVLILSNAHGTSNVFTALNDALNGITKTPVNSGADATGSGSSSSGSGLLHLVSSIGKGASSLQSGFDALNNAFGSSSSDSMSADSYSI